MSSYAIYRKLCHIIRTTNSVSVSMSTSISVSVPTSMSVSSSSSAPVSSIFNLHLHLHLYPHLYPHPAPPSRKPKKKQKRGVSRSHNNVTLVHVHNSFLFISHLFCFLFSFQTGLIDIRKQKKARGASDGDIKQDRTQDRNRINTDRQTQIADRTDRQDGTEQDRTD